MIKKKKKSELNRVFLMRIFEKAVIKRKTGPTVLETLWTSLHSGTEQCCESSALIAFYRQVNTDSEKLSELVPSHRVSKWGLKPGEDFL